MIDEAWMGVGVQMQIPQTARKVRQKTGIHLILKVLGIGRLCRIQSLPKGRCACKRKC